MQTRSAPAIIGLMLSFVEATLSGTEPSDSLKFRLRDGYQVIAHGAIGPLDGVNMLVDTGTIPSMIDTRIATKLHLEIHEAEVIAFGRKNRVRSAILPPARIGPVRADAVLAAVGDLSFLGSPHVDAIIGLDILTRSSFSIDYGRQLLTFRSLVAGDPSLHLEVTPPFLTVQVALHGHPFRLLVDTGSRSVVLFEERVRGRLPNLLVRGDKLLYHLGGVSHLQRVMLPRLEVSAGTIGDLEALLSNAPVDRYPSEIDGILGVRAIATTRADFDFERNRFGWQ
jgi:hypothetical protein